MLERPKFKQAFAERDYHDIHGVLDTSNYRVQGQTTVLGGPMHQWLDPKTNKYSTGSAQAGTNAVNAFTGFRTYQSNSYVEKPLYTEQSEGELVAFLDTRTHHGYDLEDRGGRIIWRYLHQWTAQSSSASYVKGELYGTVDAYYQQQSYSGENNFMFFLNEPKTIYDNHWELDFLADRQSTESHGTISPEAAYKFRENQQFAANITPRHSGRPESSGLSEQRRLKSNFSDHGNIAYYYHSRMSRKYYKEKFYYMSPKNNMHNSASTGGKFSNVSMSGWSGEELKHGFYRSGIRPVSRSYERADVQDYRPNAINNLYHGGCKLVGSDFNMPVLDTVDGGPVVEFTDTSPNRIMITQRTAEGGDIVATGQTMTRGL
jgi:hypothetical protein